MFDFQAVLVECRKRLARHRSGLRKWLGLAKPLTYDPRDDVSLALQPHYQLLLESGDVVWGALAQVNSRMFLPGTDDLPGVTVYSSDPHFETNPQDLRDVAAALWELKNTYPVDPDLRRVANSMTNEYDLSVRNTLPGKLTDLRRVYSATTLFHRSRLPGGTVRSKLVPLLVSPQRTEANMIVPLAYWPALLQLRWGDLDEICFTRPVTGTARQVAIEAEKGPPPQAVEGAGDSAAVRVTDAAAQEILAQVARLRAGGQIPPSQATYFSIGIHTAGAEAGVKYATLALEYDVTVETCVESNGIRVLLRIDQLERMRGTVVDFRNSLYGAGFTIDTDT